MRMFSLGSVEFFSRVTSMGRDTGRYGCGFACTVYGWAKIACYGSCGRTSSWLLCGGSQTTEIGVMADESRRIDRTSFGERRKRRYPNLHTTLDTTIIGNELSRIIEERYLARW